MKKYLQKRIFIVSEALKKLSGSFMPILLSKHDWIQVSKDRYGFSEAKSDGSFIDIRYTKYKDKTATEARYSLKDLQSNDAMEAVRAADLMDDLRSMSPEKRAYEIADAMLAYGIHEHEVLSSKKAGYKKAGDIDKPQKCKYCKQLATKAYVWAEGRAYIPVCEKHKNKAKDTITKKNKDSIDEVRDIPIE